MQPAQQPRSAFQGRARTIGGQAEPVAEAAEPATRAASDAPGAPVIHTITFYLNGIFTVDNGTPVLPPTDHLWAHACHVSVYALPLASYLILRYSITPAQEDDLNGPAQGAYPPEPQGPIQDLACLPARMVRWQSRRQIPRHACIQEHAQSNFTDVWSKALRKAEDKAVTRSGASSRQFVQMCLLPWLIQRTGMTTCSLPTFRRQAHCLVCMATGPPRRVADPENMDFLESLNRGQCPRELEPPNRGTPINVNLLRKEEEWSEPEKPRYVAFSGSGRTLAGEPMSSTPHFAC